MFNDEQVPPRPVPCATHPAARKTGKISEYDHGSLATVELCTTAGVSVEADFHDPSPPVAGELHLVGSTPSLPERARDAIRQATSEGVQLTPEQCVEARNRLGWSQRHLAQASGASFMTINHYERTGRVPKPKGGCDWLEAIQITLEAAGAVFADSSSNQADRAPTESGAMTPKQCREARRLLGMTQHRLARIAKVHQGDLSRFENTGYLAHSHYEKRDRVTDLRAALEAAGAEFTFTDVPGVLLRKAEP